MSRPWMPLDPAFAVKHCLLSAEEFGALLRIILWIWRTDGRHHADDRALSRVAGVSLRKWRTLSKRLMQYARAGEDLQAFLQRSQLDAVAKLREPIPPAIRRSIFARDGHQCTYCGDVDGPFHIDHVVPVASGGRSSPDNLVVACIGCNLSKRAKPLDMWLDQH